MPRAMYNAHPELHSFTIVDEFYVDVVMQW